MLIKYNTEALESTTIFHSVTLVPRLEYSINLLDDMIEILTEKRHNLKNLNQFFVTDFDESDMSHLKSLELERIAAFSLEVLSQIKKRIRQISGVTSIPEILPVSIPLIRTVSAQLFDLLPNCSRRLSELSVHLGSIVLDSAVLTKARFDFSQSNQEYATLLNEVKLMADSKISKQYPNLDFFKACNT